LAGAESGSPTFHVIAFLNSKVIYVYCSIVREEITGKKPYLDNLHLH